jgi:peptide-methionine (S)-S-oxide reductase
MHEKESRAPMRLPFSVPLLLALGGLVAAPVLVASLRLAAPQVRAASLPEPARDLPARAGPLRTAVLAGGCFWGMEAVFERLRGVTEVVTGYAGGTAASASYTQVSSGGTGHAEGIRITYDPSELTYGQLLRVFFSVAHDPTQHNRQGPDVGPQYRSAIFTSDPAERRVAEAYIAQLDQAAVFDRPIATRLESANRFHPAEPYHQDFVARNPAHPYVVVHDLPKLARLEEAFPELVRQE